MRRETDSKTKETISKEQLVGSSKLVSLLALAAGAVAMPETGNANIVYQDNSGNPGMVGFSSNPSYTILLPGTARLGFQQIRTGLIDLTSRRRISVGQTGGYVRLKTHLFYAVHVHVTNPATQHLAWNQINESTGAVGKMGKATYYDYLPHAPSYDHDYLPFEFKDSTQGNQMRYGWVDISFHNSDFQTGQGPAATIWRYAYDDSGAQIFMGQTAVPEPAAMSLIALGAMALGARGVRAWRKRKNF
jgi:hypothetical protein